MFEAFGWVIVQSNLEIYPNKQELTAQELSELDDLDEIIDQENKILWQNLKQWITENGKICFKWNFYEHLNNISGVLQFCYSRNHTSPFIQELLTWIAENGASSYGVVYINDEESQNPNEYRILRLARGEIQEFTDSLLSPIIPTLRSSPYS